MSKRPRVFVHGTARNLADQAIGYSCNGESMYTRNISAAGNTRLPGATPRTRGKHTTAALIAEDETRIAKLRGDLLLTDDLIKRAKIEKSIAIKTSFILRLKAEKNE
jgi:hypothetical protein